MNKKISTYPSSITVQELSARFDSLEEHVDLPLLILPKIVLFPGQSLPISSLDGLRGVDLQLAQKGLLRIGVLSQIEGATNESAPQLSLFGTEAIITGLIKLSDGGYGAILKGVRRLIVNAIMKKKHGYTGNVTIVADKEFRKTSQFLASVKALKSLINKVIKINPVIPQETVALLYTTDDPVLMCDLITPHLSIATKDKLAILSSHDFRLRMRNVLKHLSREVELLELSSRIQEEVRNDMHENLKKSFLREQMGAIKRELGELDGDVDEIEEMRSKFEALALSKEARSSVVKELDRLGMMHPGSPEYMVAWNYLNWIKELPWGPSDPKKQVEVQAPNLDEAARILDKSHYGLDKVKERILESIAILQHRGDLNGQILLLVGPPGVGKTSLVRSIAEALGRPFAQISLGGVKDEAEVRGHRRTYIGAMPGKIIQALKAAGRTDCVVLLDEIDKVGSGASQQSDLSSALLEILDPEQNKQFTDHYLGFPFDLSKVIFIATANSLDGISGPLLDRMERIAMSSYTENEKIHIAKTHIIPSLRREFKLSAHDFSIDPETSRIVIRKYTREAGVRQLRRDFSTIGRKIVRQIVSKRRRVPVCVENLNEYLGQPRFSEEPNSATLPCGVAIGLAYTAFGGDILYIESTKSLTSDAKSGGLTVTGSLGKVMKESVQTAYSFILSQSELLGLKKEVIEKSNLHIHFPDGATPKDGPSAGVAILCTMLSLFSEKPISASIAMTGEITLRGKVLPVGGIKEKLLAAHRYGKRDIIIPKENWSDLDDLPAEIVKDLRLYPIDHMHEALLITNLVSKIPGLKHPTPMFYSKRRLAKK